MSLGKLCIKKPRYGTLSAAAAIINNITTIKGGVIPQAISFIVYITTSTRLKRALQLHLRRVP